MLKGPQGEYCCSDLRKLRITAPGGSQYAVGSIPPNMSFRTKIALVLNMSRVGRLWDT